MNFLNRDLMILLGLELNLTDIRNLCLTSRRFNDLICKNDIFWINKLYKEFPQAKIALINAKNINFKNVYISLITKGRKYYAINILDENGGSIKIREYLKKYKEFSNIKYTIRNINENDVSLYDNVFYTIGDFH